MDNELNRSGVVLCGGKSSRMGRPKAGLLFGSETLLQRVVGTLLSDVSLVVVVAAAGQDVPEFDERVLVVRDSIPDAGPLVGLEVGLAAAYEKGSSAAFVTSCDSPFLKIEFVRDLFDRISNFDVVVPKDNQFHYPLAAVYRTGLYTKIAELIRSGERRPRVLYQHCKTLEVPTAELAGIDPKLCSLENLNTPDDYRRALKKANLDVPMWLDSLGTSGNRD